MFQFSKTQYKYNGINPISYFAKWTKWFQSQGIKTEIKESKIGFSLWRDGTEAKEPYGKKLDRRKK